MSELVNKDTGQVVNLEGDDYLKAVKSGRFQPPEGQGVTANLDGGGTVSLPGTSSEFKQNNRLSAVTPEDTRSTESDLLAEQLWGGAGQEALTLGEGALSGATFGLSDKLLTAAGAETAQRAETNPTARFVGELGGAIVPGLLSGGTGAVGGLARAIPAGGLVAKTAGLSKSLGGLKGALAAGALEGAAFGAGQAVSQLALHNIPLTSEAGISEIGLGAVFGSAAGLAGGAAFHGLGKLSSKLESRAATKAADDAVETGPFGSATPDDLATSTNRLGFDAKEISTRLSRLGDDALDTGGRIASGSEVSGSPSQLRAAATERHTKLTEFANELRINAIDANQPKLARQLKKAQDNALNISNTHLAPGMRVDSKSFKTIQSKLYAVEGAVRSATKRLHGEDALVGVNSVLDDMDNAWHGRMGNGQRAYRNKLVDMPTAATPGVANPEVGVAVQELNQAKLDLRKTWGLTTNDTLSDTVFKRFARMEPDQALEAAASLRNYQEKLVGLSSKLPDGELAASVEQTVKELSDTIAEAIPAGANPSQDAVGIMKSLGMVSEEHAAQFANNSDELLKLYLMHRFLKKGASIASDVANKHSSSVGKWVGKYAGFKAGGAVNQVLGLNGTIMGFGVRQQLMKTAVGALAGVSILGHATGGVLSRVEGATAKILKGVTKAKRVAGPGAAITLSKYRFSDVGDDAPKGGDLYSAFKARSDELSRLAANPMSAHQTAYDNLTGVRQVNPFVADQMEMKAVEAAMFLHSKMPKDPGTVNSFGKSRWKPDEGELIRWANYVKAVADPVSVLEDAANGTINPQGAEALRTVYPTIFAEAQKQLVQNAEQLQKNSSYDQRVRLSVLFGVAVDSSVTPEFTKYSQNFWAERRASEKPIEGSQLEPNEPTNAQKQLGPQ